MAVAEAIVYEIEVCFDFSVRRVDILSKLFIATQGRTERVSYFCQEEASEKL